MEQKVFNVHFMDIEDNTTLSVALEVSDIFN